MVLVVKKLPASAGDITDAGSVPGSGRSPGKRHGNYSSSLAWRVPWTGEPGGLQSIGSQRVRHNRSDLACKHARGEDRGEGHVMAEAEAAMMQPQEHL